MPAIPASGIPSSSTSSAWSPAPTRDAGCMSCWTTTPPHKHQRVQVWQGRHPRVRLHFTPTYVSWLHLVRGRITRREVPEFWERAADVCGLYLIAPDNALVLAVDEKTGIGARSRTRPRHPASARPCCPSRTRVRPPRHRLALVSPPSKILVAVP